MIPEYRSEGVHFDGVSPRKTKPSAAGNSGYMSSKIIVPSMMGVLQAVLECGEPMDSVIWTSTSWPDGEGFAVAVIFKVNRPSGNAIHRYARIFFIATRFFPGTTTAPAS